MQMPGRSYSPYTGTSGYRYGMNGQEIDVEIASNPNIYTAEYWEYDARTGRRWNQDPKPNPSISNYATFACNPIWNNDLLGDTVYQFDYKGKFAGIFNDGKEDITGGILKAGCLTKYSRTFSFNDPSLDTKGLREGNITGVSILEGGRINEILEKSGVFNKTNQENKYDYAEKEGPAGKKMDYVGDLGKGNSHKLFLMGDQDIAYNNYDAGNFLWGMGMKGLGFSESITQWGAEYAAWEYGKKWYPPQKGDLGYGKSWNDMNWFEKKSWTGDAAADQRAIENGYRFKPKLYVPFVPHLNK